MTKSMPEACRRDPRSSSVTADTITDAQIRELQTTLFAATADGRQLRGLVACHDALGRSHRRSRARAHCAELLNGNKRLTAATITDAQIRDLLELDEINLVQFHQATDDIVGWTDASYRHARKSARARCAEIFNACNGR